MKASLFIFSALLSVQLVAADDHGTKPKSTTAAVGAAEATGETLLIDGEKISVTGFCQMEGGCGFMEQGGLGRRFMDKHGYLVDASTGVVYDKKGEGYVKTERKEKVEGGGLLGGGLGLGLGSRMPGAPTAPAAVVGAKTLKESDKKWMMEAIPNLKDLKEGYVISVVFKKSKSHGVCTACDLLAPKLEKVAKEKGIHILNLYNDQGADWRRAGINTVPQVFTFQRTEEGWQLVSQHQNAPESTLRAELPVNTVMIPPKKPVVAPVTATVTK